MGFDQNLWQVESAVSATASGNLTWDRWMLDCAIALGISGQRNPLGFAMVRYLSDPPSVMGAQSVILALAKQMEKRGVPAQGIYEVAFKAFEFWQNTRCPSCMGRGTIGKEYAKCPVCDGTGQKKAPSGPEPVLIGISCLMAAEEWLEGQLRSRMKDASYPSVQGEGYRLNLTQQTKNGPGDGNQEVTPRAPSHE